MLMVKTKVSDSKIHGIGLFADQDILKGQIIWKFEETSCDVYSLDAFQAMCAQLSLESIIELMHYSYIKDHRVFHIRSDAKHINHSIRPNIGFLDWTTEVAKKDIKAGEEILENYLLSYDSNDFFVRSNLFSHTDKYTLLYDLENPNANRSNVY